MNNGLKVLLSAIITLVLAWVILSCIFQWCRPAIYTATGAVNWWTTLWIVLILFVILWIVLFILYFVTKDDCCVTPSGEYYASEYNNQPSFGLF